MESYISYDYLLQAFVGVAKDLNAIVIAFRGTQERRFEILVAFFNYLFAVMDMDVNSVH